MSCASVGMRMIPLSASLGFPPASLEMHTHRNHRFLVGQACRNPGRSQTNSAPTALFPPTLARVLAWSGEARLARASWPHWSRCHFGPCANAPTATCESQGACFLRG